MNPQALDTLRVWRDKPEVFVRSEFGVEPDAWQLEALQAFPHRNRLAFKACKGPGKTAVEAWLIWNFLATRPHARINAASITGDNLAAGLWPELAKWQARSRFLSEMFTWTATAVTHKQHPATWWARARSWPKKADPQSQADSLAGLHEDYAMWVLDEAGGIPVQVLVAAEAVLSSGIDTKVVIGGNTTSTSGALHHACERDRRLWHVITITGDPDDPNRSPRISLQYARDLIQTFGRDNPWVMVNVLGLFPPGSFNALLSSDEVEAAMRRHLREDAYAHAQKRLGVDVARYGDDLNVIFPRQGLASFKPVTWRNQRTQSTTPSVDTFNRVMKAQQTWGAEVVLMDATGGWGAGARDLLINAARATVIDVNFGAPARDPKYKNIRSEILFLQAEWIKNGGALPFSGEMLEELTATTYVFTPDGKLLVEPKQIIKEKLGRSPDLADAHAVTFGMDETPAQASAAMLEFAGQRKARSDWDPFA